MEHRGYRLPRRNYGSEGETQIDTFLSREIFGTCCEMFDLMSEEIGGQIANHLYACENPSSVWTQCEKRTCPILPHCAATEREKERKREREIFLFVMALSTSQSLSQHGPPPHWPPGPYPCSVPAGGEPPHPGHHSVPLNPHHPLTQPLRAQHSGPLTSTSSLIVLFPRTSLPLVLFLLLCLPFLLVAFLDWSSEWACLKPRAPSRSITSSCGQITVLSLTRTRVSQYYTSTQSFVQTCSQSRPKVQFVDYILASNQRLLSPLIEQDGDWLCLVRENRKKQRERETSGITWCPSYLKTTICQCHCSIVSGPSTMNSPLQPKMF